MVADQEVYDIGRLEACSWFVVNPGLFFESFVIGPEKPHHHINQLNAKPMAP